MKILILSTQYNRYGGSATCAYELHKYFLNNKQSDKSIDSVAIFFDNVAYKQNENFYNQDLLENVFVQKIYNNLLDDNFNKTVYTKIKDKVVEILGHSFIVLCFNYIAPIIGKLIFTDQKVYYMVVGTNYINNNNVITANVLLDDNYDVIKHRYETKAIEMSDYVVPNTFLMKNIMSKIYNIMTTKPLDLHEIYKFDKQENKQIYEKEYDIIFICSNFNRKVKNIDFVQKIYNDKQLKNFKKIVIGTNSNKFFKETENLKTVGFIDQEEIINYIRKSKVMIIPSFIESYSIVCIEATNNDCIPLLSRYIGCNTFVNKYYILQNLDIQTWIDKIINVCNNFYYHKTLYYNDYKSSNTINDFINKNKLTKKRKVLFVSVDVPGNGGAATNTFNLIKKFEKIWDIYSIFISDSKDNIKNLKNYKIMKNDDNLLDNLLKYKNENEQIDKFDFIFCKNYKNVINLRNIFKNTNIIFSPSGLINAQDVLYKTNDYINNVKLEKIHCSYINCDSKEKFIKTNDKNLDILAFNYSDIIIPNSALTFNIIDKIYGKNKNILKPIYLTNINYDGKKYSNECNYNERKYDIMFCSFSWKRKCKNINMVYEIINKCPDKKILVIGNYFINKFKNVDYFKNIEINEMNNYYKKSKVLVIPSFYDSNPNTMIEAIVNGCNIVTTDNVGSYEFLEKTQIVKKYHDVLEWKEIIYNSLETPRTYKGHTTNIIKKGLNKIVDELENKKTMVGIYKINPHWDVLDKPNFKYFIFNNKINDTFVENIVNYDIYFDLTVKIGIKNKCNDINYIIIDENIETNECYYVYKTYAFYNDNVKIWKIKSRDDLFYFNQADIYFLRGNYHKFYDIFTNENSKTIFYPATSFKQNIKINTIKPIKYKYDYVMIHENPLYKLLYETNKTILFKKFSSDGFINMNIDRIYDCCFIVTGQQPTKNYKLFFDFIEYLELNEYNFSILLAGNLCADTFMNTPNYFSKFKNIKITNIQTSIDKDELITLYNKSKTNILFSGRDAFPRVLSESLACGCFNIAFDTLSDGQYVYDNELGVLIGDVNAKKKFISGSLCYEPTNEMWNKIINEIEKSRNHIYISLKYKNEYNINNLLKEINF